MVRLPTPLRSASARLGAPKAQAGQGETLLVVDDEEAIRSLIKDVLCEDGYRVLVAEDAEAALEHLTIAPGIALMVTDIGLTGGMDGRQLAHVARQNRPGLPIVLMTGCAPNSEFGDQPLEPGMALLTKPFTMAALTVQIQELLIRL